MSNDNATGARTIKASEFKAKCLKLMDEVAETGEEYVVSKNGRPVARLVPYRRKPKSLFGIDRGKIEILGDIVEPLDVEWEAGDREPGDREPGDREPGDREPGSP